MKASLLGVALTVGLVLFGCGSGDSGGSGGPGGSGGSGGAGASGGSGGAGGTGGAGGAGGAGGTGGAGGAGGAGGSGGAMMLSSQGTVENTCGPADGPALDFRIGTPSTCPIMPYAQAFVHYYVEPGSTGSFAPGQSWSSDAPNGGNTAFVEWGSENNQAPAKSGSVEIISVAGNKVVVRYAFVTAAGEAYAGEADIVVCPSMPMCG